MIVDLIHGFFFELGGDKTIFLKSIFIKIHLKKNIKLSVRFGKQVKKKTTRVVAHALIDVIITNK